MKKLIKMIGLIIVGALALLLIIAILFLNLSPKFGRGVSEDQKMEFAKTNHYKDGKFVNTLSMVSDVDFMSLIKNLLKNDPTRRPRTDIEVQKIDSTTILNHNSTVTQLTWFGHSAFLLEMDGKKILIDPMMGESASPISWLGGKRYSKELPIEIEKLPFIDAVIISHDHYDHLDYGSIMKLKSKVGRFFTPLGVGNHLLEWGVDGDIISELDWWESIDFEGIELICTPARHYSGRGVFDKANTLWCSWVIKGENEKIFFSGDSGYGVHFKEIGDKHGPFDVALIECGQYNDNWKPIHMMPEETAQAAVDVKANVVMPIHWGAFTLAMHAWTDPVERLTASCKELDMPVTVPAIGEVIIVGDTNYVEEKWWELYTQAK